MILGLFTLSTLTVVLWLGALFLLWWSVFVSEFVKGLMSSKYRVVQFIGFYFACTIWYGYGHWLMTAREHPELTFQQYMGNAAITMLWVFGTIGVLWLAWAIYKYAEASAKDKHERETKTPFGYWLNTANEDVLRCFTECAILEDELKEFFVKYPKGNEQTLNFMLKERGDSLSNRYNYIYFDFVKPIKDKMTEEEQEAFYNEANTKFGGDQIRWRLDLYTRLGIIQKYKLPPKGAYDHIQAKQIQGTPQDKA